MFLIGPVSKGKLKLQPSIKASCMKHMGPNINAHTDAVYTYELTQKRSNMH